MTPPYTCKNLNDVEDAAAKFGFEESQESRFVRGDDLDAEQTGLSFHRFKPGKRQGFAHRHDDVEEIYVVLAGSGRMKLDDEVITLERLDAVRVSPGVTRAFEADNDGLEVLAFSPRREDDRGEIITGWWTD
jgi:mannose-6-phosphate isomerase-like protein (cupin superfamily)